MKIVGNLKDSVAGLLQGVNLDNITGLNSALERAARNLVQQADIPEASGRQEITLYDGVYNYLTPTTIFGTALVDIRPQGVSRTTLDIPQKRPVVRFDSTKNIVPSGYEVAFEYKNGVGIMRIAQTKARGRTVLDTMKEDTGWVASGSASTPVEDATVFYESPASLRFTLTGSSTGIITKTLTSAVDLASYEDVAVGFLAIRTPSVANLTSITVRLGSDASNYVEITETDGFLGAWTADGWLLVAFDFSTATSTGTPDWTALDYLQVRIAHTGTITNFRVGGFWLSLPSPHEVLFQSSAIFLASGASASASIVDDNDSILLNDAAYLLYEYECAVAISEQSNGGQPGKVSEAYKAKLHGSGNDIGLYSHYRADNPSAELRTIDNWYND
jgi:hypothetical protein